MAQKWIKRGLVLAPPEGLPWMTSHASVPCATPGADGGVRVFFSSRDAQQRSRVGWFDFDPGEPGGSVRLCEASALEPGGPGTFDESGTMGSWVLASDDVLWLYYVGWNRGVTVPFYNSIGLARSYDGGVTFERVSEGPIVGRDRIDPYFTASSCVLIEDGLWRMWYVSCVGWKVVDGALQHFYHIRHATSEDGVDWRRNGEVSIDFEHEGEYAISRPCVLREGELYRMWYSWRGARYRLGYAESEDGLRWVRRDASVGLEASEEGWDSEMVEYPCVFDQGGRRYMLYNGNAYGGTGIGLAEQV